MGRTQPRRDAEFIAWAQSLATRCTECQTEWGLDPASVQKLNTLTHDATTAYEKNCDISTCNRVTQVGKNTAFAALRLFLRQFVLVLRSNETIGEDELEALGLPPRRRHARLPLPAPAEAPEVYITSSCGRHMRINVRIPEHGRPTKSRTRKAYHGFVARYRKEGDSEWRDEYTTRLHTDLYFADEDIGMRLVVMAAWINPRLQHGPWSSEIHALVN